MAEKELKLKKPRADYLDNRRDLPARLGDHLNHAAVLVAAPLVVNALTEASVFQVSALGTALGISALYQAGEVTAILEKCLPDQAVSDRQLGYKASRYVYRGPGIRMGNAQIKEDDAFFYLQLPRLQTPKDPENAAQAQISRDHGLLDIGIYSLNHLADKGKKIDYRAVIVEIPDFGNPNHAGDIPGRPDVGPNELFENKGVETNLRGKKVAVLTKEQLEKLFEPQEEFTKLARELDDTTALELLYITRNATDPEMKKEYLDRFSNRLNQLIIDGVYDSSASPTSVLNRGNSHRLRKQPVRRNVLLVKDAAGIPSAQIIEDRSIRIESLKKLLKIEEKKEEEEESEPDEKDESDTQEFEQPGSRTAKRARAAHLAQEKVEKGELDDFFEMVKPVEIPIKEDILEDLAEEGIRVKKPESIFKRGVMPDFRGFTDQIIGLRSKVSPIVSAGLIYAAVVGMEWLSGAPIKENYENVFESTFPFVVPPDIREWKVEERGLDSAGYYALGTASDYRNGRWDAVTTRVVNLQLPRVVEDQDKLRVSRRRIINPWADNSIKVPIKNKTKVAAVDVREVDGDQVPIHTVGLEDGTVELVIPSQGFNYPWAWHVDIHADLVETQENTVKAVRGREPLDLTKLSPESLELINLAHSNPEAFAQVLTQGIKDSHYYSIDPPGKWSLFWNRSPEKRVNAMMELEGGSCIVVNEGLVLFLSNDPEGRPSALVFGYPYGIDSPAAANKKKGVLTRDTSHGWGILGKEIYDATSGTVGQDANTEALINQVKGEQAKAPTPVTKPEGRRNEPVPAAPEPDPESGDDVIALAPTLTSTPVPRPTAIFRPVVEVLGSATATAESTPKPEPTATPTSTKPPESTPTRIPEPPKPPDLSEPSKPWTPDFLTLGLLGGAIAGGYFLWRHQRYDPANPIKEGRDGSIRIPIERGRVGVKRIRLSESELAKAYSFLSLVSYDPFGGYMVPSAEDIKTYDRATRGVTKKPSFDSINEIANRTWLRAYDKDPEVFDGNAQGLTEEEKQKIRQLARFIVNGV